MTQYNDQFAETLAAQVEAYREAYRALSLAARQVDDTILKHLYADENEAGRWAIDRLRDALNAR